MEESQGLDNFTKLWNYSTRVETSLLGLDIFLQLMETRDDFPYSIRKQVRDCASDIIDWTGEVNKISSKDSMMIYTTEGKGLAGRANSLGREIKNTIADARYYREQRSSTWTDELNERIMDLEKIEHYVDGMINVSYNIYKAPTIERKAMTLPSVGSDAAVVAALILIAGFGGLFLFNELQLPTGNSILPTGNLVGVSLPMFYIIVSAVIITVVALLELRKIL